VSGVPAPYARVRQSVAAALYVRNRMQGEVLSLQRETARLRATGAGAELAIRRDELARAERDLASARREASEAMAALLAVHADLRSSARARLRGRAGELAIQVAAEREASADPLEERFRELVRRGDLIPR
jgi:hypothetical protein